MDNDLDSFQNLSLNERTGLTSLPSELLIQIFLELDIQSLMRCKQVCKLFDETNDLSLTYHTELALAGLTNGPSGPGTQSTQARLALLRAHQHAWSTGTHTDELAIPNQGHVWELNGGVMGQAIDQHSLKFHKLPSKLRGVVGKEWVTDCGGISVRDFAMDPREDLLVVVELAPQCNIHILTLSTGKPHPLSLSPKIQAPALKGDEARSFKIIISGYLVGVMVLTRRPPDTPQRVLVVYDWRSGGLIMEMEDIEDYAFLTDSLLMIAKCSGLLDPDVLEIHNITHPTAISQPIQSFLLFQRRERDDQSFSNTSLSISSGQPHEWVPRMGNNEEESVPFYTKHEDRTIVLTYFADHYILFLVFTLSSILSHLPLTLSPPPSSDSDSPPKTGIPWEDWGPHGLRIIDPTDWPSSTWVRRVYGRKFIVGHHYTPSDRDTGEMVELYDFNPEAVRYHQYLTSNPIRRREGIEGEGEGAAEGEVEVDITPAPIFDPYANYFMHPVTGDLPCLVRRFKLPARKDIVGHYDGIMITEDAIIAVSRPDGTHFKVFCF